MANDKRLHTAPYTHHTRPRPKRFCSCVSWWQDTLLRLQSIDQLVKSSKNCYDRLLPPTSSIFGTIFIVQLCSLPLSNLHWISATTTSIMNIANLSCCNKWAPSCSQTPMLCMKKIMLATHYSIMLHAEDHPNFANYWLTRILTSWRQLTMSDECHSICLANGWIFAQQNSCTTNTQRASTCEQKVATHYTWFFGRIAMINLKILKSCYDFYSSMIKVRYIQ